MTDMTDMTAPAAHAEKQLILCADDFAVHASASQGIAQLAAQGRLSATSAMVLSPRWAQDAALLRDMRDHLDVGLHLDWTSTFALQRGHGLSLPRAMWRSLLGGFDPVAARVVIEQQLDAFEAQWQAPPDFVDGHQHVQQFAGIRQALVAALHSRYGTQAQRPYLRISRAPAALADTKSRVIAALGASPLEALARQAQLPTAAALLGIYDFTGDEARYAGLMRDWLQAAPPGSLLMCHPARALPSPGYADAPHDADDPDAIGAARTREFAYLGSAAFAADLARARVTLARGKTIFSNFGSPT